MRRESDISGKRYGKLVAIRRVNDNKFGQSVWLFKCDCGNEKHINKQSVLQGRVSSCGCYFIELHKKHGLCTDKIYRVYADMKNRCYNFRNKRFADYGGRGISVCNEWLKDFINFYNWSNDCGYKEGLTIDRIDVNGNYEPSNCRWITNKQQQLNKRNSVIIEHKGIYNNLIEWARQFKINPTTLKSRLKRGWSVERAFEEPVKNTKRKKSNDK